MPGRREFALCLFLAGLGGCKTTEAPPGSRGPAAEGSASQAAPPLTSDPLAQAAPGDWSMYRARTIRTQAGRPVQAQKGEILCVVRPPQAGSDEVWLGLSDEWRGLDMVEPSMADLVDKSSMRGASFMRNRRGLTCSVGEYLAPEQVVAGIDFTKGAYSQVERGADRYQTGQGKEFTGRGHVFACQRLAFHVTAGERAADVRLWLAPEVLGRGLVALRLESRHGDEVRLLDLELIGYGTEDETLFGQPRELHFED